MQTLNVTGLQLPPIAPKSTSQAVRKNPKKLMGQCTFELEGTNFFQHEPMQINNFLKVSDAVSNGEKMTQTNSARSTSCSTSGTSANKSDFRIRKTRDIKKNLEEKKVQHRFKSVDKTATKTTAKKIEISRPRVPFVTNIKVQKPEKYTVPLEKWIYKNIMIKHNIPGVQVVFAVSDEVVYDHAFGYADIKEKRLADNSNFHRIASVSKAVTRACLDRLIEKKLLNTHQKVFPEFLTEFSIEKNPRLARITVQHLIDHSVGLWGTVGHGEDPMFWYMHKFTQAEVIQKTIDNPKWYLDYNPSVLTSNYSNFGYVLLGRVIEKITGKTYIDFVREEFNVDARLATNFYDTLLPNENSYYSTNPSEAYSMHLARMDSAAGLIINPRELVKLALQAGDYIDQRGSIAGSECRLDRRGRFTMAAFCNRRKGYLNPLALDELFDELCYYFG